ncbi:MAG: hypothetical protein WDW38_007888 [Sanguina aurantia]
MPRSQWGGAGEDSRRSVVVRLIDSCCPTCPEFRPTTGREGGTHSGGTNLTNDALRFLPLSDVQTCDPQACCSGG